jgi:uncharacterized membrane protein YdjX (TVP38/TMEM64 family)
MSDSTLIRGADRNNGSSQSGWKQRLFVIATVAALFGMLYYFFGDYLSLQTLAEHEAAFRQYQQEHPAVLFALAFVAYVAVTGLSLPGAAAMTLLMGWLFGFVEAVILVSFASTTGATLAFLLSRYLFRDGIQRRFGDRLRKFNDALEREGAFYLFSLRLIPAVPFFVINVVMGLTPVRLRTYWWVSQVGMLPGTGVFVFAGSNVPSLQELAQTGVGGILDAKLIVSFVLLGLFPLTVKKFIGLWKPARRVNQTERESDGSAAVSLDSNDHVHTH